ncbi:pepsin-like aspartic protease [Sporobolomyces salmoneus]|uniref:pepsin-like aspartic protease n=1 Tax=Sporobolomyces salmoneus TaxID=183962 RepID=UPI00317D20A5
MHASPISSLSLASTLAFLTVSQLLPCSTASPTPRSTESSSSKPLEPLRVPIKRRNGGKYKRDVESFKKQAANMRAKYGAKVETSATSSQNEKRAGTVEMTSYQDSEWYGEIDIGTPAAGFSVVLDTGSADLIVAEPNCEGCKSDTPGYQPSSSSTASTTSQNFQITYGSGSAEGTLVSDIVSIANYTVQSQTFAACSTLNNIVDGELSGILGLGFQTIASSGATPLVQALAQEGKLPEEVFGFAFETHVFTTASSPTAPGGTLTIGGVDTSAYSGSINWIEIVQPAGYWSIPLQDISVGGQSLGISVDQVVIDTGTTLIGVPTSIAENIYSQIPNSQSITLDGASGYYSFPCSQTVQVSLKFGGQTYSIDPTQFNGGAVDNFGRQCLGAIFSLTTGSNSPSIIVGDAFLTGVYSAYRFSSPEAVGFATLGSGGSANTGSSATSSSGTNAGSTVFNKFTASIATVVAGIIGFTLA